MPQSLEEQLGAFLRKERGEQTFSQFSKKVGLPVSTVFRLERAEQSITLDKLQGIMGHLRCKLSDIFEV